MNASEAGGDLGLIDLSVFFILMQISFEHKNYMIYKPKAASFLSKQPRLPAASLSFKGEVTERTSVKVKQNFSLDDTQIIRRSKPTNPVLFHNFKTTLTVVFVQEVLPVSLFLIILQNLECLEKISVWTP